MTRDDDGDGDDDGSDGGDVTFFLIKGGQLDLPVGKVTFLCQKEVSWIPLSVTSRFCTKRPDDPV